MEQILDFLLGIVQYFFDHLMFINGILAIIIVFFQRKNPKTVWTWLLALYFLPVVGFFLYLLIGIDMRKEKMFRVKEVEDRLHELIRKQERQVKHHDFKDNAPDIKGYEDLVMYNLDSTGCMLTDHNDIDIFVDGNAKFDQLIEDMRSAEKFIHIQYYIIKNDVLFKRIIDVLKEKASQGVEVRILYDAMGCRFIRKKFWRGLNKAGIKTAEFFPAFFRWFQLRINYRNHRKIVVIDNKVGYVGGFNIGKEYIGLDPKFGHWRDTHLRIKGEAVSGLELRFMLDWNYTSKENLFKDEMYSAGFEKGNRDGCDVQIIYSGPDTPEQQIRDNYIRLINKAEKSIYIQSPYFIPDEAMMAALNIALHSGIEVNIMIPCMPDHPFVYWATYSYMGEMVMNGANCYVYDAGFLHSKGIIVDEKVFCYGTANMDVRSFALNFEVNATVYNEAKAIEMTEIFKEDIRKSTLITKDMYAGRKLMIRFKEQISRLLSPLL